MTASIFLYQTAVVVMTKLWGFDIRHL